MANPYKLSRALLANFMDALATALGGTSLTAIPTATRTALQTSIGTLPADLTSAEMTVGTTYAAYRAAVAAAEALRTELLGLAKNTKDYLAAGMAPNEQYAIAGYDPPVLPTPVVPADPTELAATGTSEGYNYLTFIGNNKPGSVQYVVEAIIGDTAPYVVVGVVTKQQFTHEGVTPGQFYQYRVKARAARSMSGYSNIAVVYGA